MYTVEFHDGKSAKTEVSAKTEWAINELHFVSYYNIPLVSLMKMLKFCRLRILKLSTTIESESEGMCYFNYCHYCAGTLCHIITND